MSGGKTALGLDSNVGAMLCYMPLCGISLIYSIIVLVTEKTNKTVRFHAFQSLLLTAVAFVAYLAVLIVGGGLTVATGSSILGILTLLLYIAVFLGFIGLMIFGCIKAFQNSNYRIPVIGDMADKWSN